MPTRTKSRTRDDVLADLEANASEVAELAPRLDALYSERHRLLHEGRAVDPRATHKAMSIAAGISEPMVEKVLRRAPK